jgi:hypothetical protein
MAISVEKNASHYDELAISMFKAVVDWITKFIVETCSKVNGFPLIYGV